MIITKLADNLRNVLSPLKFKIIEKYSFIRYESTHRKIECNDSSNKSIRLNLVVPTINESDVFGGVTTALKIFEKCYKEIGCDARIISLTKYKKLYNKIPLEFVDLNSNYSINTIDIDTTSLEIRENDYFFATYWSTALLCEKILKWQNERYEKSLPLVYLIQDYEPGFYPWSTEYVESERTYHLKNDTIAVFNSSYLKSFFENNGYSFYKSLSFEPVLNSALKEYLKNHGEDRNSAKRKKQILIYGRPQEHRNAFTLIVNSLKALSEKMDDSAKEWTIISLGAKHENIKLMNGMEIISKGKVSLEEYAQIMLDSYAGVSLMISPHPSYPPLEMSTFGVRTITNSFLNKDLNGFNDNICSLDTYDADSIAECLYNMILEYPSFQSFVCTDNNYVSSNDQIDLISRKISDSLRSYK